ncbi:hypothetical protein N658DRAFT_36300 [Parathielavia hyrcaniae]|uniref:Uncharacterized protein n=1 Tax=Parathielavia hyrcaniae TaxID=113614 RepID=A0AAN6QGG0_9PEZI|nr:hypothetical protein N658DRAFT_36300 [Parathielavia hyrcaniae]
MHAELDIDTQWQPDMHELAPSSPNSRFQSPASSPITSPCSPAASSPPNTFLWLLTRKTRDNPARKTPSLLTRDGRVGFRSFPRHWPDGWRAMDGSRRGPDNEPERSEFGTDLADPGICLIRRRYTPDQGAALAIIPSFVISRHESQAGMSSSQARHVQFPGLSIPQHAVLSS